MAVPTREHINELTNTEFAIQHPGAPKPLDPHDPAQAHLVQAWRELYTRQLNLKVDEIFFSFYPHAPNQLDPGDPSHAQLIEFWNDIRDRIEHGTSRWDWNAAATAANADPVQGAGQMDEGQFTKFIENALNDVVQLYTETDVWGVILEIDQAGRGPALPWLDAALGDTEVYALEFVDAVPNAHSSSPGAWQQEKEGFCYGLLWEVARMDDASKSFAGTPEDSAEHLREAFYAGVATGRQRGAWPSLRNRVLLLVGHQVAHGASKEAGYRWLLNVMWHNMDTSRDLSWPVPEDQR